MGGDKEVVSRDVEGEDVDGDDDEEKPLMGPHELLGSYGSVVTPDPQREQAAISNGDLSHISPPSSPPPELDAPSSPFKRFSMSRGVQAILLASGLGTHVRFSLRQLQFRNQTSLSFSFSW